MTAPAAIKQSDRSTMEAQEATGWVYFISNQEAGVVNVGWANSIRKRMESLQTGNHQELLLEFGILTVPHAERVIQRALATYRVRGEWYRYCGDVYDLIEELEIQQSKRVAIHHDMSREEILAAIETGFDKPFSASDIEAAISEWRRNI